MCSLTAAQLLSAGAPGKPAPIMWAGAGNRDRCGNLDTPADGKPFLGRDKCPESL
jgi:hypothetical protein